MNTELKRLKPELIKEIDFDTGNQIEAISFYLASDKLSSEIGHHIHNLDSEDLVEYYVLNAIESTLRDSCGMGGRIYIHNLPSKWIPLLNEVLSEVEENQL